MMNIPSDVAHKVVEGLRGGGPFLMALMIVNVIALMGFGFVLSKVADSMERRESFIKACLDNRST